MKPVAELRVQGDVWQRAYRVTGLRKNNGDMATLNLKSDCGKFSLSFPPELAPFLQDGDVCFLTISCFKAYIESDSPPVPILKPKAN